MRNYNFTVFRQDVIIFECLRQEASVSQFFVVSQFGGPFLFCSTFCTWSGWRTSFVMDVALKGHLKGDYEHLAYTDVV